jgi:hypothetical protein
VGLYWVVFFCRRLSDYFRIATRTVARPVNTSAFIDTNPTDEPITSGLP